MATSGGINLDILPSSHQHHSWHKVKETMGLQSITPCSAEPYNRINFKNGALIREINHAKASDLKSVHTQGHWVRDMRAVGYQYQWRDRIKYWLPAAAIGIAGLIIAAAALSNPVTAALVGTAAVIVPIAGILVTAIAWAERESNKNQLEQRLTNEFRSQRSALLTAQPEDDGPGKVNEFSRHSTAMNAHVYKAIRTSANEVLSQKHKAPNITNHEWHTALDFLLGSKEKPVMTPMQAIQFKKSVPEFIFKLRRHLIDANFGANGSLGIQRYDELKKKLAIDGFDKIEGKHFSKIMANAPAIHLLEPIEVTKPELTRMQEGQPRPSDKLYYANIDQVISIKKIPNTLNLNANNEAQPEDMYRLFVTAKLDLIDQNKQHTQPKVTEDQQILVENQIKRAMIARGETTWAGHGVDNLKGLFEALNNPGSKIYQPGLTQQMIQGNDYLKSWSSGFAKIKNMSSTHTDKESQDQHLRLLDLMSRLSSNEYDFLLLERTGSRDPFSTGGQRPKFINRLLFSKKGLEKRVQSARNNRHDLAQPHRNGINLPFQDKKDFRSTHCAPFHSHDYFLKMHNLDMIDYQGVNIDDGATATALSRKALINIHENKRTSENQCYSEHGLGRPSIGKRKPSFGPAEANNSKSISSSIKRHNSSQDILVALASIFKLDVEKRNIQAFKLKNFEDIENNIQWNQDPIIRDMTHAMNISTLHNEVRRLEASIHDLTHVLNEYQKQTGACSTIQKHNQMAQNPIKKSANTAAYLDTVIFQKKIKVLTSEVADQINNVFKTQIDHEIAYSNQEHLNSGYFSKSQHQEMKEVFKTVTNLSKSKSLKNIFQRSHISIAHNRNRFLGGTPLNGLCGRARLPFFRQLSFRGTMNRLLSKDTGKGIADLQSALNDITSSRFAMESALSTKSETFQNLQYLEGLVL